MTSIVCCHFAFEISFTPSTPIIFPAKLNYLYQGKFVVIVSIRLCINERFPKNLYHWMLCKIIWTETDRFYLRDTYPRKVFASPVSYYILPFIKSQILNQSLVREFHFLLLIMSIEGGPSWLKSKFVSIYQD